MAATIKIDGEEFVTADEAAALLGVEVSTRQGSKRRRLYRRDEVAALLELAPSRARISTLPLAEDWIPLTC